MSRFLFELSKEHPQVPCDEIIACLKGMNIRYTVLNSDEDFLLIQTSASSKQIKKLAYRLSHTFFVNNYICSCMPSISEIKKHLGSFDFQKHGTIAIRYKNRSQTIKSQPIIQEIARQVTKNNPVDLQKPDHIIRVLITDHTVHIGEQLLEIDRTAFEQRKVQHRPFFSPISLHPKLARALVNLSNIQPGSILCDPCCGTGGILLEAGLMGISLVGNDVEKHMINGCKQTLDFYNVSPYQLFNDDIGCLSSHLTQKVDAVVTDLPYGKSTTTKGESIEKLYSRCFQMISQILHPGKYAVIGLSQKEFLSLADPYLSYVDLYTFKVHRSLIRYFTVFQS